MPTLAQLDFTAPYNKGLRRRALSWGLGSKDDIECSRIEAMCLVLGVLSEGNLGDCKVSMSTFVNKGGNKISNPTIELPNGYTLLINNLNKKRICVTAGIGKKAAYIFTQDGVNATPQSLCEINSIMELRDTLRSMRSLRPAIATLGEPKKLVIGHQEANDMRTAVLFKPSRQRALRYALGETHTFKTGKNIFAAVTFAGLMMENQFPGASLEIKSLASPEGKTIGQPFLNMPNGYRITMQAMAMGKKGYFVCVLGENRPESVFTKHGINKMPSSECQFEDLASLRSALKQIYKLPALDTKNQQAQELASVG